MYLVGAIFSLLSQCHIDLALFAPHELSDFLTDGRVAGAGGLGEVLPCFKPDCSDLVRRELEEHRGLELLMHSEATVMIPSCSREPSAWLVS